MSILEQTVCKTFCSSFCVRRRDEYKDCRKLEQFSESYLQTRIILKCDSASFVFWRGSEVYIWGRDVTTNGGGNVNLRFLISDQYNGQSFVSATAATDLTIGDTSEFAQSDSVSASSTCAYSLSPTQGANFGAPAAAAAFKLQPVPDVKQ